MIVWKQFWRAQSTVWSALVPFRLPATLVDKAASTSRQIFGTWKAVLPVCRSTKDLVTFLIYGFALHLYNLIEVSITMDTTTDLQLSLEMLPRGIIPRETFFASWIWIQAVRVLSHSCSPCQVVNWILQSNSSWGYQLFYAWMVSNWRAGRILPRQPARIPPQIQWLCIRLVRKAEEL